MPVDEPIASIGNAGQKPGRKTEALAPQRIINERRLSTANQGRQHPSATERSHDRSTKNPPLTYQLRMPRLNVWSVRIVRNGSVIRPADNAIPHNQTQ